MFMSKTKVWIIGAKGRLGSTISDALDRMEYNVLTSDLDVDITDMDSVTAFMDMSHPAVVINCAGYNTHDWAEEDMVKAFRVNAIGARNVASASRKVGAKLIHMSTDDVFDGQGSAPLTEFDVATPDTVFGKSKLAGENFVRELNPKHLIVRSSWVYAREGSCFVNSVIRQAKEGGVIRVAAEQYSSPTSAKMLADFIMKMIDANEYGIYHASCEGCCSRVEAAEEILRLMGQDPTGRIEAVPSESGKNSPRNTFLRNLMMEVTGIYRMPWWQDAMKEYIQELRG